MAHLFPFIVFAIVIIARMIANAGKGPGDGPFPPGRPAPRPSETEEERLRRFMEAVGLPPDAKAPPPVQPRNNPVPPGPLPQVSLPNAPFPPGRLRRAPAQQPAQRGIPPVAPPALRKAAPQAGQPAPVSLAVAAVPMPSPSRPLASKRPAPEADAPPAAVPAGALLARLRDPTSIRQAVILREVLGPPKALQEPGILSVPR